MRPHRTLEAWKESIQLVKEIYILTREFPSEEKYGLISQLRRAAVSISLNIAEGAARQSDKEYVKFLFISEGSISEVDTILELTRVLEIISEEQAQRHVKKNERVSALVSGLRKSIERKIKEKG